MIGSEELMNELSKCLFENFDSKYSEYNRYSSFDPNIIRSFLNYLGPAGGIITIAEAMKKFIDFIKSKKVKENIRENVIQKPEQLKDGTISIKRLQPGNILMMSGNGPEKPVVEACDTFPLFIIQRGYILILSNLRIHLNYDKHKLVKEYKAPSFMYDGTVEIVRTSSCDETPGKFRVKKSIWVGKPEDTGNKKEGGKKYGKK